MRRIPSFSAKSALLLTFGVAGAIAAPAACFYPSYTFTEAEPTGGGGTGPATSASQGGGTSTATSSASVTASASSGMGGMGGSGGAGGSGGVGGMGGMTSSASSSSAASTTATSSAASTTASSSSTGVVMPEDCTDGIDNDLDGKVDCADTDCQAFSCHNPVPAGWTGHYALFDGAIASLPGNCPGASYPNPFYTGYRTPTAAPAMCTACTCTGPTGEMCNVPQMHVSNATCAQQLSQLVCAFNINLSADGACHVIGLPGGQTNCGPPDVNNQCPPSNQACDVSLLLEPTFVSGGTCTPNTQMPTIPPFSWNNAGRACQAVQEGKGCANNFACLPNTMAPFGAVCISHAGDVSCPGGSGYNIKHVYFDQDPLDTRDCDACMCAGPNAPSCTTNITTYSDFGCTTQVANTAADTCSTLVGNPAVGSYKSTNTQFMAGSCTSSGGTAMGAATGVNAITFCCQ